MRLIYFILFNLLITLSIISCSKEELNLEDPINMDSLNVSFETKSSTEYEVLTDQPYGENPEQIFDIYLPEDRSTSNTKVLILIHGGSWRSGNKSAMNNFIPIINNINPDYAIVNMNYTLANNATPAFPNQFLDIDSLINTLVEKSEEYQIKPEFGLIGRSAGAHLALMYDYTYDHTNRVKFVCNLSGPTNFKDSFYQEIPNFQAQMDFLVDEDAYPDNADLVRLLSPALQVNWCSSPTLIFHGRNDTIVPFSNARKLKRKLNNKGIPKKLVKFVGVGHANWDNSVMEVVEFKLKRFMNRHFPI